MESKIYDRGYFLLVYSLDNMYQNSDFIFSKINIKNNENLVDEIANRIVQEYVDAIGELVNNLEKLL